LFEVERTQMVHEETVRNLKESQLEIEKMQNKVEVGI
jgi:progesterone-induced-blocking factor 1